MRYKAIPILIFLLFSLTLLSSVHAQPQISIGTVDAGGSGTSGSSSGFLKYKTYYMLIWQRIRNAWVQPESLKGKKDLETVIAIQIARDGQIVDMQFEKESGNLDLDNSALRAIKKASPFPPLPPDFEKDTFDVGVSFSPSDL